MRLPLTELSRLRAQGLALRAHAAHADAAAQAELAAVERQILDCVLAPEPPRPAPRLLLLCAGAALLLALAGYAWKGRPDALRTAAPPDRTEEMVQRLAQRLAAEPQNAAGWAMLGRSYAVLGRSEPAIDAYRKALALEPERAAWLADLADVLATTAGGQLAGEPATLLARALQLEPTHPKALALDASRAVQANDPEAARQRWQTLLANTPVDHPLRRSAEEGLAALPAAR
ncbi:tetratricopeptide repeat protein [Inhella gelatinilytica]|uniref:Cytochrome c-type biogenesis protein H TPR domain-containing protein n=1 Tax=Inhella gelatinilytica TaxID=2795030 RepID=A0A931IW14_9BURK|nr:hypothetical protein [Inhella gelatinilytica]MBH9552045.1 hypothetical protein [Inhella gelatinilytica]